MPKSPFWWFSLSFLLLADAFCLVLAWDYSPATCVFIVAMATGLIGGRRLWRRGAPRGYRLSRRYTFTQSYLDADGEHSVEDFDISEEPLSLQALLDGQLRLNPKAPKK